MHRRGDRSAKSERVALTSKGAVAFNQIAQRLEIDRRDLNTFLLVHGLAHWSKVSELTVCEAMLNANDRIKMLLDRAHHGLPPLYFAFAGDERMQIQKNPPTVVQSVLVTQSMRNLAHELGLHGTLGNGMGSMVRVLQAAAIAKWSEPGAFHPRAGVDALLPKDRDLLQSMENQIQNPINFERLALR